MKTIVYWATTGMVASGMLASGFMYLTSNVMITAAFQSIGLPLYIIPFLGIAKVAGAIALVVPRFPKVKEWAYAGFAFTFLGATWIHIATATAWIGPVVFLILLSVSYFSWMSRLRIQTA